MNLLKKVKQVTGLTSIPVRVNLVGAPAPTSRLTLNALERAIAELDAAVADAYSEYDTVSSGKLFNNLLNTGVPAWTAVKAAHAAKRAIIARIELLDNRRATLRTIARLARQFGAQPRDNAFRVIAARAVDLD